MRGFTFLASLLLVFTIPWENAVVLPGLGTVSRALGLIVAALWCASILTRTEFRRPLLFHFVMFSFFAWNALSLLWTANTGATLIRLSTNLQLAAFVLIFWDLYRTPTAIYTAMQAYVLGSYACIASLASNYLLGHAYSSGRFSVPGFNPNDVGLILALGIPIAWYLAALHHGKYDRWLQPINYVYLPAAVIAIAMSGSRGAVVASIPALAFVAITSFGLRLRAVIALVLISCTLYAVPRLLSAAAIERVYTIPTSISTSTFGGRMDIWREGLPVFLAHPMIGVGAGVFESSVTRANKAAHNVYLAVLVELGVIGFVGFICLLALVLYHAAHQPKALAQLWITVLAVWLLGAFVHSWEWKKHTWLMLSYITASAACYRLRTDDPQPFVATVNHA